MMLEDLYRLLRSGHVQAQGVVDTITQPIIVLDQNLCVSTANNAFIRTFKVERDAIAGQPFFALGNGQWNIPELRQLVASVIPKAAAVIGFEVKHDFPTIGQRTFLVDARRLSHPDDNSSSILVLFDDVTERQRNDAEMGFIIAEMRHRMKNLFAVVRAIALQTDTKQRSAIEYRDSFLGRLNVTLRAQEMTADCNTADFETLLTQSVGALGADRIHCEGPAVELVSARILSTSMIFHELATNAVKYGALSVPDGRVSVKWQLEDNSKGRYFVVCTWQEEGGPTVAAPERTGYGTQLIKGTAAHLGGSVELTYGLTGLTGSIRIPL